MWSRIKNLFKRKPQQWELQIPSFKVNEIPIEKLKALHVDVDLVEYGDLEVKEVSTDYLVVNVTHQASKLALTKKDIQTLLELIELKTVDGQRPKQKTIILKALV